MGAENSVLEGCLWGEEVVTAGLDWDLQHAELKDGRPITVFQPRKNERKYNDMIRQLAKSLKMLRHPRILRYIGAGKSSEGYFLATEQATPLAVILDTLSPLELCSGLSDILEALTFLHEKAGVTHNNLSVSAIFVCKDGSWKLGELQHACPFSDATADFLDACRAFRNQDALAPEEKQNTLETKSSQGHARDMYGMGVLWEFDKSYEQKVAACLSSDPAQRPRALELRNDSLFQNDFIQILSFVRNVALKTVEEKTEFFRDLLPRLIALPEELVARRLVIPLLSRFVLLEDAAVTHVVPHLLTPRSDTDAGPSAEGAVRPLLSAELFRCYVVPELQRILLVHDSHIRLVLLQHFSVYAGLFDRDTLQGEVFPQILIGLRDSSDSLSDVMMLQILIGLRDSSDSLSDDILIGLRDSSDSLSDVMMLQILIGLRDSSDSLSDVMMLQILIGLRDSSDSLSDVMMLQILIGLRDSSDSLSDVMMLQILIGLKDSSDSLSDILIGLKDSSDSLSDVMMLQILIGLRDSSDNLSDVMMLQILIGLRDSSDSLSDVMMLQILIGLRDSSDSLSDVMMLQILIGLRDSSDSLSDVMMLQILIGLRDSSESLSDILIGLRDSSDSIVAGSLRALADLVPLLGGDVVIGGHRKTFFFQGMPKFLPTRERECRPSSAGEVLWPHGKKLLANGKPLLQDLLAGGVSKPGKDVDEERRRQERERRREEARKKKEERQRKFRLLQAEMEMEQQQDKKRTTETDKGSTDDGTGVITDVITGVYRAEDTDTEQDEAHDSDKAGDKSKDVDKESLNESGRKKADSSVHVDEENFASEESEEEWEDWEEDKDSNSGQKSQDDIISDEIEAELSQMPGNRRGGKKVPTSPDPYMPSSPTDVDWSDSHFDSVVSHPKKFHTDWTEGEKDPQGVAKKDNNHHPGSISDKSSDSKQTLGKGLKLVSKNKNTPAAKTTQAKKTTANDDLGLGYDIKSIELSVAIEEEDFFADMRPDIKPAADNVLMDSSVKTDSKAASGQSTQKVGLSLFAVAETGAEESAGWEEEGDWGGDF
ncbi:hypothetical protein ACOMHN_039641 [Nucella lapillus]